MRSHAICAGVTTTMAHADECMPRMSMPRVQGNTVIFMNIVMIIGYQRPTVDTSRSLNLICSALSTNPRLARTLSPGRQRCAGDCIGPCRCSRAQRRHLVRALRPSACLAEMRRHALQLWCSQKHALEGGNPDILAFHLHFGACMHDFVLSWGLLMVHPDAQRMCRNTGSAATAATYQHCTVMRLNAAKVLDDVGMPDVFQQFDLPHEVQPAALILVSAQQLHRHRIHAVEHTLVHLHAMHNVFIAGDALVPLHMPALLHTLMHTGGRGIQFQQHFLLASEEASAKSSLGSRCIVLGEGLQAEVCIKASGTL